MAKDPAFLFYPNDYLGGTTGMTLEEKGAYMELLVMQFNKGAFTKEQAKKLLNGQFEELWSVLSEKFTEQDGKFFNKRLETEKEKRKFVAEKNKDRIQAYWDKKKEAENTGGNSNVYTECLTKSEQDENENENENNTVFKVIPINTKSEIEISELDVGKTIQFIKLTAQHLLTPLEVQDYYKAFNIHAEGEPHLNKGDRMQHFRNWLKKQNLNNETKRNNTPGNQGNSKPSKTDALKQW